MAEIPVEKLHKAFTDLLAGRGSTLTVSDRDLFFLPGPGAVGRRPAAGRPGARHRPGAPRVHAGRTPGSARCRVPRGDVRRAAGAARSPASDHGVRDARSARGHVHGRHHRADEQRRRRATRAAAGDLRPPRERVRGRFRWLASDELHPLPRARRSRRQVRPHRGSRGCGARSARRDRRGRAAAGSPTGAGKTTTLRLVAGLEAPDAGRLRMEGRDITGEPPSTRDVAFVFQQYSLYPHLSVYDNLAFPLRSPARRIPEDQVRARVTEIARLLHLQEKLDNRATRLSGGQMQRVAIGRALVRRPAIFLMDEPLSSLDAKLRAEMRVELERIHRELGATILYVTHDQTEAMTMAARTGVLEHGRLVQLGSSREIYEDPINIHVAKRLGSPSVNLMPRQLFPSVRVPEGAVTIGVRTEHVRIRKSANGAAVGRVRWIEHLGDQSHLHVTVADTDVITLADPHADLAVGDEVAIEMVAPLFFDASGERVRPGGNGR